MLETKKLELLTLTLTLTLTHMLETKKLEFRTTQDPPSTHWAGSKSLMVGFGEKRLTLLQSTSRLAPVGSPTVSWGRYCRPRRISS